MNETFAKSEEGKLVVTKAQNHLFSVEEISRHITDCAELCLRLRGEIAESERQMAYWQELLLKCQELGISAAQPVVSEPEVI